MLAFLNKATRTQHLSVTTLRIDWSISIPGSDLKLDYVMMKFSWNSGFY